MQMTKRSKVLIVGSSALVLAAAGAGVALGSGSGDDGNGQPIKGSALDHASAVALDATGGGEVNATEVRDEEGYYEIEVSTPHGGQVDVHLDRNFNLIDQSVDGGGSSDDAHGDD